MADERARARSQANLSRELHVRRDDNPPDPSRGGSRGFPLWYRQNVLNMVQNLGSVRAAADASNVSQATIYQWQNRVEPYRMTGGREREALVGKDQFLMAQFIYIYPSATLKEIAAFLYTNTGNLYSDQLISRRLKDLDVTRKKASTEAYQAFSPQALLRLQLFFTRPPPLGVYGVRRRKLIDMDEFGVAIQDCNRSPGFSHRSLRIRKPGHYCRDTKITVIMAIEPGNPELPAHVDGSVENPRRRIRVRPYSGTTAADFASFCDQVCSELEQYPASLAGQPGFQPDMDRVFMWDNLRSHLSPLVYQTVEGRKSPNRFRIVRRPPYQPKYGPIEYCFAEMEAMLSREVKATDDTNSLMALIQSVASRVGRQGNFKRTFEYCGYEYD